MFMLPSEKPDGASGQTHFAGVNGLHGVWKGVAILGLQAVPTEARFFGSEQALRYLWKDT